MSTQVTGGKRSYAGSFTNPKAGIPTITFAEEYDCQAGADAFVHPAGSLHVDLTDPQKPLSLRNPADDSEITLQMFIDKLQAAGGVTFEDVHLFWYSLYRQSADERDAAVVAMPAGE